MSVWKTMTVALGVLLVLATGCGGSGNNTTVNNPYEDSVQLTTRDLTTGVGPDCIQTGYLGERVPISVALGLTELESFVSFEQGFWEGNIRVVRWPSLEPTEGRWVLTSGTDGGGVLMTFTPDTDLPEGWYALQVNFPAIHERAGFRRGILYSTYPVFDDWTTSRFRVGSLPITFIRGGVAERGTADVGAFMEIGVTEPVHPETLSSFLSHFHVTAEGESLACRTQGDRVYEFGPTQPLNVIHVGCDPAPAGARVTITIDDVFTSAAGVGLHDLEGRSPPRWDLVAGESVSQEPGDGLFAVTADRASP